MFQLSVYILTLLLILIYKQIQKKLDQLGHLEIMVRYKFYFEIIKILNIKLL